MKVKGISLHSIVPVRVEASEGAEQSTQMLFGETASVLAQQERWTRLRLDADGQEGWVDTKMITPMSDKEYRAHSQALKNAALVAFPMTYAVSENNGQTLPLTAGTRLTHYVNGHFEILGVGFRVDPNMVITKPYDLTEHNLQQVLRFFLNTPYLWGGKNALGMDCSGFTQTVMSLFGKHLLRNASEQVTQGRPISSLKNARAGDLVFFDHYDNKVSHVGIVLQAPMTKRPNGENSEKGNNNNRLQVTLIHCSGRVKVERLDEKGIFSVERADKNNPDGQYTHHLIAIRRV